MKFSSMLSKFLCCAAATLVLSALPVRAIAEPAYKGFQIGLAITDSEIQELKNTYHVNLVRILIGSDALMDSVTGQAYIDMMESVFALADPLLVRLAQNDIKVVFALYSPPGGFQTRDSPSKYRMFVNQSLQQEYIDMWLRIMARYKDNSTILAFDLLNEPAQGTGALGAGVDNWNTLLKKTITAIRTVAPTQTLMIKSLYGDPSKLTALPEVKDAHVIYSYHPYIFLAYQQSGIYESAVTIPAPSKARIESKLLGLLGKFYYKHYLRFLNKKVSGKIPVLNAGEIAVSALALDSGQYFGDLLSVLEDGKGEAARKKALKKLKKRSNIKSFKDMIPLVSHHSYTIHGYGEAQIWDPRYSCSTLEQCSLTNDTDRNAAVISHLVN